MKQKTSFGQKSWDLLLSLHILETEWIRCFCRNGPILCMEKKMKIWKTGDSDVDVVMYHLAMPNNLCGIDFVREQIKRTIHWTHLNGIGLINQGGCDKFPYFIQKSYIFSILLSYWIHFKFPSGRWERKWYECKPKPRHLQFTFYENASERIMSRTKAINPKMVWDA